MTDLRIQQPTDYPTLNVNLDRTKAEQGGYTTRDVAQSMLNSLSGSFQITPMFYLNYKNGVNYNLVAQTPQYRMDTLQDIQNIPINSSIAAPRATPEVLGDLTSIRRDHEMAVVSHYNIRRVVDIYGAVQDRDLGAVAKDVEAIVHQHEKNSAARHVRLSARPGADDAQFLCLAARRAGLRHRARLHAHRGELPVLAGSLHHHHGAAGGAGAAS